MNKMVEIPYLEHERLLDDLEKSRNDYDELEKKLCKEKAGYEIKLSQLRNKVKKKESVIDMYASEMKETNERYEQLCNKLNGIRDLVNKIDYEDFDELDFIEELKLHISEEQ
jgi:peptidoglycan hydrolase CwlO-like protein